MSRNGHILQAPRPAGPHVVRRRFQGILGKRRTIENIAVLTQAQGAYMGLEAQRQGDPRPRRQHLHPVGGRPRRPRQRGPAAPRSCAQLGAERGPHPDRQPRPPAEPEPGRALRHQAPRPERDRLTRGLHCMVDTSPPLGMLATSGVDPVARLLLRGRPPRRPRGRRGELQGEGRAPGPAALRGPPGGLDLGLHGGDRPPPSTCSDKLGPAEKAAAALGIYTDTSALLHGATPLDFKMFEVLTRDGGDPGHPRRAARLPRSPGVVRLPRGGLPEPGGDRGACAWRRSASSGTTTAT